MLSALLTLEQTLLRRKLALHRTALTGVARVGSLKPLHALLQAVHAVLALRGLTRLRVLLDLLARLGALLNALLPLLAACHGA